MGVKGDKLDDGWGGFRGCLSPMVLAWVNGEVQSYIDDASWYEFFFDKPYPYTREEWERDIKGKSLFELMPKEEL